MAAALIPLLAPTVQQIISAIIAHEQAKKANPSLPATADVVTAAGLLAKIEATDAAIEQTAAAN